MKSKITIIVPVKDEEHAIQSLLDELALTLRQLVDRGEFYVLVVDDGSTDRTAEVVKKYNPENFALGVCSLTRNFGKEAAISAGLESVDSDAYIIMDGDLQHPPGLIPEMLQYWAEGYKIVEAVKADRGTETFLYRWFSRTFYHSMKVLAALDLSDLSDYKLLDRELVDLWRQLPEKNRFFRGIVQWTGYPTHRIPFTVPSRAQGDSSWTKLQLIKYSVSSIASFSSSPLLVVAYLGLLMLIVSLLLSSVTLFQWISGIAVTGFTTVIILLLFIGSLIMISLGVIGLYISKIYEEIKARPSYLIKEEAWKNSDHD